MGNDLNRPLEGRSSFIAIKHNFLYPGYFDFFEHLFLLPPSFVGKILRGMFKHKKRCLISS